MSRVSGVSSSIFIIHLLMEPQYKRQLSHQIAPQQENADIASLSVIGMRIRKAVAEGYKTGNLSSAPPPSFSRVPLPQNLEQPPALVSLGSTFQSGSNLSDYGSFSVPSTTLPTFSNKRRLDDEEPQVRSAYEEFCEQNGQLRFDEEF